ncbi:MAG: hypothetical protein FWH57_12355 [Oscillospiraceae bacterium]|nr:hypothetical protein [Oscillospiraceae bacterium]
MTKLSKIERVIARLLVDLAIRKTSIPYSDLSKILEREYGEKINEHFGLSKPLGNVATLCNELGLPILSVRIEYKNNPSKTAEGFYDIACKLKPAYKSMKPNEVRNKELELTRNFTEWQLLLDYLDDKTIQYSQEPSLTISEQIALFAGDIIAQNGIGHIVSTQEIINELIKRHGTNQNSVLPFDYCYNRLSDNSPRKGPLFLSI